MYLKRKCILSSWCKNSDSLTVKEKVENLRLWPYFLWINKHFVRNFTLRVTTILAHIHKKKKKKLQQQQIISCRARRQTKGNRKLLLFPCNFSSGSAKVVGWSLETIVFIPFLFYYEYVCMHLLLLLAFFVLFTKLSYMGMHVYKLYV